MVVLRHEVVGGIEADPAPVLAAPERHPGMGGVGPLQALLPRRRLGAQIAADIGGGQAQPPQAADHDVAEVLADPATGGEGRLRRGGDVGGLGIIAELVPYAAHQLRRCLEDRPPGPEALPGIVGDGRDQGRPRRGIEVGGRSPRAEITALEAAATDQLPGLAGEQGQVQGRMHVHAGAGLDHQGRVGLVDQNLQHPLAEGALLLLGPGGLGRDGHLRRQHRLGGGRGGRQPQHALGKGHRRIVPVGGAVPQLIDHASPASFTFGVALAPCRK